MLDKKTFEVRNKNQFNSHIFLTHFNKFLFKTYFLVSFKNAISALNNLQSNASAVNLSLKFIYQFIYTFITAYIILYFNYHNFVHQQS